MTTQMVRSAEPLNDVVLHLCSPERKSTDTEFTYSYDMSLSISAFCDPRVGLLRRWSEVQKYARSRQEWRTTS